MPSVLAPSLGDTAPTPLVVGFEPLLGPPCPANDGLWLEVYFKMTITLDLTRFTNEIQMKNSWISKIKLELTIEFASISTECSTISNSLTLRENTTKMNKAGNHGMPKSNKKKKENTLLFVFPFMDAIMLS